MYLESRNRCSLLFRLICIELYTEVHWETYLHGSLVLSATKLRKKWYPSERS